MKVQRVRLPETHQMTWLVLDDEFVPVQPILTYLRFLHDLDRSPNTIRASAHHLKLFWEYLRDEHINWTEVDIAQLAGLITWLRRQDPIVITLEPTQARRTNATIDLILSAVHGFYSFHMRLGTVPERSLHHLATSYRRRYKPFLHGIAKAKPEQKRVVSVKRERRLPKTLTDEQVRTLIAACTHTRDKFLLTLSTVVPTQSGGTLTENESFCYDALNRLAWAGNSGMPTGGDHCMAPPTGTTLPTYSQAYTYDNLDRTTSGAAGSYTYADASQVHAVTSVGSVPNPYAAYDAMGNMICRNVDPTNAHTCGGSTPTGALMSYDNQGQLATWSAPSGVVGSAHYLYDNQGNRVLTNSSSASSTTDTVYFDGYTETLLSGGTRPPPSTTAPMAR